MKVRAIRRRFHRAMANPRRCGNFSVPRGIASFRLHLYSAVPHGSVAYIEAVGAFTPAGNPKVFRLRFEEV